MSDAEEVPIIFRSLDREAEIEITARNLPHWFQVDAALFVTFRTADSLPKEVVQRMISELREYLIRNDLPIELADSVYEVKRPDHELLWKRLDSQQQRELKKLADRLFHRSLDDCQGECILKDLRLAQIVLDAIRKFDGARYDLDSVVIMPNHVHAIVQFREEHGLKIIGQSWMRYSARMINQRSGRTGVLWQPEPFDHIIRSPEQYQYLHRYIADNPGKAKLVEGESLYWKRV